MSCRGNHISILERIVGLFTGNKSTQVSHVSMKVSSNFITNISESFVVKISWVSGESSDDELWFELKSRGLQSIVVNQSGFKVNVILL